MPCSSPSTISRVPPVMPNLSRASFGMTICPLSLTVTVRGGRRYGADPFHVFVLDQAVHRNAVNSGKFCRPADVRNRCAALPLCISLPGDADLLGDLLLGITVYSPKHHEIVFQHFVPSLQIDPFKVFACFFIG